MSDKEPARVAMSEHLVRVWSWMETRQGWATAGEIAAGAKVAGRTARAHAAKLVSLSICDVREVFPGHRYRLSPEAEKRNKPYLLRLRQAKEVLSAC